MKSAHFSATLLRTNASGYAALVVTQLSEMTALQGQVANDFDVWKVQFTSVVLELASEVRDGTPDEFARRVGWLRDAFRARDRSWDALREGVRQLGGVLEESLPEEAWKPLPAYLRAGVEELERPIQQPEECTKEPTLSEKLAVEYVNTVEQGDGPAANKLVLDAIRQGRISTNEALGSVMTTALFEVGRKWHSNRINVAQEHFATICVGRLIEQVILLAPAPTQFDKTVVLTMVEGDAHDLGLKIVAALFELDGWRTICLGANLPCTDLALAVEEFGADLVVLGATMGVYRETVEQTLTRLKTERPEQKILVGGSAFSGKAYSVLDFGADACATNAGDAVRIGRELVAS